MKNFITFVVFIILLIFNASGFASEPTRLKNMVKLHNEVRLIHGLQALTWSDSLARYAQEWVDHLAKTQNCEMIHRPNKDGYFQQSHGENLFWSSAIELEDGMKKLQHFSAKDIIKAWAEEENYYDYQTNTCQPGEDCGHYTQMVWHESRQVGCAIAVCTDKSQLWACNYHPRGNYIGEWPY